MPDAPYPEAPYNERGVPRTNPAVRVFIFIYLFVGAAQTHYVN